MKTFFPGVSLLLASALALFGSTLTVTNNADSGSGSLRDTIANAASGDTVTFALPVPSTITLTTGELLIDKDLTVTNPATDALTITRSSDGGTPAFGILHISSGNFAVTVNGLIVTNGKANAVSGSGQGGGLYSEDSGTVTVSECTFSNNQADTNGGAVCQNGSGTLTLTDCTLTENIALSGYGGGLAAENSSGAVQLLRCTISSNTSNFYAGGIYNFSGSSMTITDSTVSANMLPVDPFGGAGDGGGISNDGILTIMGCTIANNTNARGSGAGINNQGTMMVDNSTFFGNIAAQNGGAIIDVGEATITNCTITQNIASQEFGGGRTFSGGGGVSNFDVQFFASTTLRNTIVAGNGSPSSPDIAGAITSQGYNLIGDGTTDGTITPTTGDQIGTSGSPIDPMLGPLADNGGPTQTSALLPGSPAIDAGYPIAPGTDQRSYDRTNAPDIGAFELGATIPKTLANISTRLLVETGDNVLIGGFIVTGTHSKEVLLRAIGPSLALDGKLANPVLELHDASGAIVTTNDDWQTNTNEQEIVDTGLAPTDPFESALLVTLDPGAYTAIVSGANNGTGIGLVEAYDLDRTTDARLANISTRGFVQTGDNVMIGGFIILGSEDEYVIVRAIGPSLPLADTLADPLLELHNADGSILATNDNWRDTQEAEIEATGLAPTNDAESAIVSTLAPGNYTAIVHGVGDTTGVALVEAYGLN